MADTRPVIIQPLQGLDQRWSAGAPSASVAQDIWYDPRQGWQSAGGYKRIVKGPTQEGATVNPFAGSGSIESIHHFSQHNGARRWTIYIDGQGRLYQFNPSTAARSGSPGDQARDRSGELITRTVVETPWQRSQSACWGDWLYLVNGIDRPLVFDGYVWDYAGWQGPAGTPTAVTMANPHATDQGSPGVAEQYPNAGLGTTSYVPDEDYKYARRYRCTFINNRGAESPLSAASEIIYFENTGGTGIGDGAHFAKVTLPIGPPNTVARRLYATQNLYSSSNVLVTGRDTQFFFHSTIPDNVTATIQDALPDGYLGAEVDETQFGTWPVNAKFIASFNGRMYAAGANNSEVYYSKRGAPEVWPVNNVLDVGDAYLGPITALYATRNVLLVAKKRGIYLIVDDGVNEPYARTLTRESGWISHNTVREIPGIGIFGLSDDGVTMLKGTLQNEGVETQTFNAGVGLPQVFKRLNQSAALNACAAVYHFDKEYWLCIPTIGNANNNLVLVYHYEVREWTVRYNYPIASILEDSTGALLFGSYASTTALSPDGIVHLGIMVYSRGCRYKDDYANGAKAIEPIYTINQVAVGSQYRSFRPKHVLVYGIGHGNNALNVNVYSNHGAAPWAGVAQSVAQQYPQAPVPVYGTATFDGNDKWADWQPITMRVDIDATNQAPVFDAQIEVSPASRYMTILGFSLEISTDDPVQAKPLKPDGAA